MNHLTTIAKAILLAALLLAFTVLQSRADMTSVRQPAEGNTPADSWSNIVAPTHLSRPLDDFDPINW